MVAGRVRNARRAHGGVRRRPHDVLPVGAQVWVNPSKFWWRTRVCGAPPNEFGGIGILPNEFGSMFITTRLRPPARRVLPALSPGAARTHARRPHAGRAGR